MPPTTIEEHEYMTHVSYANTVGSLMYVMVYTGPDLSQAISMISRDMHDPDRDYWEAVKCVLRYIKGTINVSFVFVKDSTCKQKCIRFINSNNAGGIDKRRSTTGCVFILAQEPTR